jgi:two-component system chemotaxis sensor kinase CheA
VHELEKSIAVLQTNILSARMLPFNDLTQNLTRIVRDLSKKRGKAVDLEIEGGDISLDKSKLEKMGDPLVHIIRNAVDHGIELPEERKKAGKAERGSIKVRAYEKKELVVIEVEDDGCGIDCEKLRRKAVSLGMPEGLVKSMTDKEALMLVCRPGLTLSDSVTYVSGRGVGMDVVKDSVESLSGFLTIESEVGSGTRVTMELLRSASIRKVLLVTVAEELFSLPATNIEKVVEIGPGDIEDGTFGYQDKKVPYLPLSSALGLAAPPRAVDKSVAVLVRETGANGTADLVALGVDDFIDELNAYIKPLAPPFTNLRGVTGISKARGPGGPRAPENASIRRARVRHGRYAPLLKAGVPGGNLRRREIEGADNRDSKKTPLK